MLYDSDDKENKEGKLFGADSGNNNDIDFPAAEANENSLFGSTLANKDNSKHDSLFDSSFEEGDIAAKDTIDSSFAISFKNNEPGSVSDKLRSESASYDSLDYEDDLEDFDFDSSISAFKPLNGPVSVPEEPKKEEVPAEPEAPVNPFVPVENKVEETVAAAEEKVEEAPAAVEEKVEEGGNE